MGAWGADIFENDAACDFASSVAEERDLSKLESSLDRVLAAGSGDIESADAVEGLAAADIVARLLGKTRQTSAYTAAVDKWVSELKLQPSPLVINKARSVVTRVQYAPSELLELWQESDDFAAWKAALAALSAALKA